MRKWQRMVVHYGIDQITATRGMNAQGPRSLPQLRHYGMGVSVDLHTKRCDRGAFLTGAIYSHSLLRHLRVAALDHNTESP